MASQPLAPAQALRQPSKDTSLSDAPVPVPTEPGRSTKEADEQSRRHCMMLRGKATVVVGIVCGTGIVGASVGGLLGADVIGGGSGGGSAGFVGAGVCGGGASAGFVGAGVCTIGTGLRVVVVGHATFSCLQHHSFLFWGQE